MTIAYTACWSDRFAHATDVYRRVFTAWCAAERAAHPSLGATMSVATANTRCDIDLTARFDRRNVDGSGRTTLRVTGPNDPYSLHSVQVTVDYPDLHQPAVDAAPALVARLIAAGTRPMYGDQPISAAVTVAAGAAAGEPLAAAVTAFARRLPLVLLVADPARAQRYPGGLRGIRAVADSTARALAGAARVIVVDPACAAAFTAVVGTDHGLPAGTGLRVYLPDTDPAVTADADRHPIVAAEVFDGAPGAAMRRAAHVVLDHARTAHAPELLVAA